MYPAIASNLKKGKGGLYLAEWDGVTPPSEADVGIKVGNCESMSYSPQDVQTTEKYSSTQQSAPLLLKEVNRASWRFSAQCDEHTVDNLLMFFGASSSPVTQNSGSSQSVTISDIVPGRSYLIGAFQVSNVVASYGSLVLTPNVDYVLYPARGVIEFLIGGAVPLDGDVLVQFDRAERAYTRLNVGQELNRSVKLSYFADDANATGVGARDIIVIPKAAVVLEGEYQLISDEFGNFTVNFDALDDSINYPGRGLGWILRGAA